MPEEMLNIPAKSSPAADPKAAAKTFSRLGLGVFLILVVGSAAQMLAVHLADTFFPGSTQDAWGYWLWIFVPLYLIGFPAGYLLMRPDPGRTPPRKSMRFSHLLMLLPVSICMMYAGNMAGILLNGLIQTLFRLPAVNPVEALVSGTSLLPRILFVVLLGPFLEEWIFRKVLIDRMAPYGEKIAVVLSSLIFGLFHGNLSQCFYAFALGLVFGYVYLRTGKLRYSFFLHAFINLIGGVVAPAILDGVPAEILEGSVTDLEVLLSHLPAILGMTAYSFALMATAIAGLILICVHLKKLPWQTAPMELPQKGRLRIIAGNAGMILLLLGCLTLIVFSLLAV